MLLWMEGWIANKMKAQIIANWESATGTTITDEMKRRSKVDDTLDRAKYHAVIRALLPQNDLQDESSSEELVCEATGPRHLGAALNSEVTPLVAYQLDDWPGAYFERNRDFDLT